MQAQPSVAVIGSGIAGLGAAHALRNHARVSLFEAGSYFGGHANTVDICLPSAHGEQSCAVDTGFLVFNERTYPHLIALFAQLDVATCAADMSFSVQAQQGTGQHLRRLEWAGANLSSVFAQRRNLFSPRFLNMLRDLLRFNRLCTAIAQTQSEVQLTQSLADFLLEHQFSAELRDWYLLPMLGCIWSCPTQHMLAAPIATLIRFCHNHGLLQINHRPQWQTVRGGSRHYVQRITDGIRDKRLHERVLHIRRQEAGALVTSTSGVQHFDAVVCATHAPQALALLADASALEQKILGSFKTQSNQALLHTDTSVLPQNRRAWSAWNYQSHAQQGGAGGICLHYLINKLQPLPCTQAVIVSLNPVQPIAAQHLLGQYTYAHPIIDMAASAAQARLPDINGKNHIWFCGAWTRYGFHEDGLISGLAAAQAILRQSAGASA